MDKSYLLHNLKIVDNAEEDHGMLDLEFQNIHYEGRDLIADVIETARYVGEVNPSTFTTKHENVSLTSAGGGPQIGLYDVTLINTTSSTKSISSGHAVHITDYGFSGAAINIAPNASIQTQVPIIEGQYTRWTVPSGATFEGSGTQGSSPSGVRIDFTGSGIITW